MLDKVRLAERIKSFLNGIPTVESIEDMCYFEEHKGEVLESDKDYDPLDGIKTEIPMLREIFRKLLSELDIIETMIS
jgi:hypothetical protein